MTIEMIIGTSIVVMSFVFAFLSTKTRESPVFQMLFLSMSFLIMISGSYMANLVLETGYPVVAQLFLSIYQALLIVYVLILAYFLLGLIYETMSNRK